MRPDPQTLERIKRIELRTRRLVRDTLAGAYHSVFKGRGITFETVRPYQPGDDIRDIDWNVTARTNEAYIKTYTEDRELTVMLVIDRSASLFFGTRHTRKHDLAAEIAAALALSAISNNDKVGLLIFSDRIEQFIPPRKGRNHILRLIRDVLAVPVAGQGTDLALALRTIHQGVRRRAIVFFLSDFLAAPQEYERDLRVAANHHDLIAVIMRDPLEVRWPQAGLVRVQDAETGELALIDTGSTGWRDNYASQANRFEQVRTDTLTRADVDRIEIDVDGDYVRALTTFFGRRARRG